MKINTNVSSLNTQRILGQTGDQASKIMGRLSSGFRINSASDDAAGLGIANQMRSNVRALQQASRNADQANSVLQIAEGATSTVASILDRMKELATQASSDNTDAAGRTRIDGEFKQLRSEISRIVSTTNFQSSKLLDGTFGTAGGLQVDPTGTIKTGVAGVSAISIDSTKVTGATTFTLAVDDATTPTALTLKSQDGKTAQTIAISGTGNQTYNFSAFGISLTANNTTLAASGATIKTDDSSTLKVSVASGATGGQFMVSSSGGSNYTSTSGDLIGLSAINLNVIGKTDAATTGLQLGTTGDDMDLTSGANAQAALTNIDNAISRVNTVLGNIGAAQNRISFASQNTKSAIQNVSAAESSIRDADMAEEMSNFSKTQILQQAGVAMLAQANQAPQMVLKLLG